MTTFHRLLLAVSCICLASGCTFRAEPENSRAKPAQDSWTVEEFNDHKILGHMGVPLGECVEIEATIIAGHSLHTKSDDGHYLLRVDSVEGKHLDKPPTLNFQVPAFVDAALVNNDFLLYEWKKGKKPSTLDSSEIAELEKDYVGKAVRLVVYESGGFSGIPDTLPKDVPDWQDKGFGFTTYLIVLKQRP